MTTEILSLSVEAMTPASFAPYGVVLAPTEQPADRRVMADSPFTCDGRTTLSTIWQPSGARSFTRLERHFGVTQAFFQLSGAPSVVCVAAPTAMDDVHAVPDPQSVRAFLIDPTQGFSYHIGTWHSLDRFVIGAPGATFIILNVAPNPTQIVDYASGRSVHHPDLDGLPPERETQLHGSFGIEFQLSL